jgi:hypothetical protein
MDGMSKAIAKFDASKIKMEDLTETGRVVEEWE